MMFAKLSRSEIVGAALETVFDAYYVDAICTEIFNRDVREQSCV